MSGTRTPTRSALARFVPFHFRDPLGLARRLLRSGSPEARFAMASAALGPFLAPLDLLLAVAERRRLARAVSPRLPLLFVMGPPRSGTTLVTLSLIRCLPVTYLNNLTALFPRAPITANLLFGRPIRHEGVTLANYYGRTRGVSGPNDSLHLWDRWLGQDRTQIPEQIEAEAGAQLVRFFAAFEAAFGGPLIAKNNSLNGCARLVGALLPTAHFLCLRREPLWLAQSLLEARRHIHGDPEVSYGIDDPARPEGLDPIADVVRQVQFHAALAARQRTALGERFQELRYEVFCEDPAGVIAHVARDVLGLSCDPDDVRAALPPLAVARRRTLSLEDFGRLERAVADSFPEGS